MDQKLLKDILGTLQSIDVSLQAVANTDSSRTASFVSKKIMCQRLSIPSVALDKLIIEGRASGGRTGLIEGVHYCRLDPDENNSSKFLFDPSKILEAAWKSFRHA